MAEVGQRQKGEHGLRPLLRRQGIRDMVLGQTVSGLGDWMATVALMALVLDISGSSAAVGGVLVLRLAPAAIAGPLSAKLVRRWNPRHTMLAMDGSRAVLVALVPFIRQLWWVYVLAFVQEVAGLLFLPARDAVIPDLVGDAEDLPLANGLILGSSYGTIPLGAAAFGLVAALVGGGHTRGGMFVVFTVDALTFLFSFAMIWRIRELRRPDPLPATGDEPDNMRFRDALRLPIVRTVGPAAAVAAVGLGTLFSLGVPYVRDVLGASNTEFGILVALFGVGAGVGLGVLQVSGYRGLAGVRMGVGAQGAIIAGMSLAPGIGLAFTGAVGFGAATAFALAAAMSVLQEALDERERVLAFTAFHVLIRTGLAFSAIGAGVAADLVDGVNWPVVGHLPPTRLVLFCSGLLVVVSVTLVRALPGGGQGRSGATA